MLWFRLSDQNEVIQISDQYPEWFRTAPEDRPKSPMLQQIWVNRNDIKSMEEAERLAASATAREQLEMGSRVFIATDSGPFVSPRYDVIEAPAVGDEVSKAFNGDYYPVGRVTRISAGYKSIWAKDDMTGVEERFVRRGQTAQWRERGANGAFGLVKGRISRWNPEY